VSTEWAALLDHLEERLRLIETTATLRPDGPGPDIGPEPHAADQPTILPSEGERVRLLTLLDAHSRLESRLEGRREKLRRAQRYLLGNS
jgi:hypothetical protein